jgi:hypothetical protein
MIGALVFIFFVVPVLLGAAADTTKSVIEDVIKYHRVLFASAVGGAAVVGILWLIVNAG